MQHSVLDVAECILQKLGIISAMKLQKLVYYCQAWSMVWEDRPIHKNRTEAWANGPVVEELYDAHRGKFKIESVNGKPERLSREDIETINAVIAHYGNKSSHWLSELTHQEDPWVKARGDLPRGARGNEEITLSSMTEYYGSL